MLKGPWRFALILANCMAATRGIRASVREAGGANTPFICREHFAARLFIVANKCARLIDRWSLPMVSAGPICAEPVGHAAEQRGFVLATQTIPAEGHNGHITYEANMFLAPIAVTNHTPAHRNDSLMRERRYLVNPLRAPTRSDKVE
jgi:hypothetical protein